MTMQHTVWLIAVAAAATAQTTHQQHPPQSAGEYIRALEDPARDRWQMPHEVVTALRLKPGDVVADIGAGTGYFARRFARHAAKVYAVDIDPKLLEVAAKNAPANLVTVLATPDDPKLPDGGVDLIFLCDVLHHIAGRPAYYRKLAKALKRNGRVVNIDFHKTPLPVGPPESMKLSEAEVIREFRDAGFRLARNVKLLSYQYFLEFRRE